jgi:hypothetical protein
LKFNNVNLTIFPKIFSDTRFKFDDELIERRFSLKFYFRINTFWSKFVIKISNKPVFRKVIQVQFARKNSFWDISGAVIFFWEWNFKISYFNISMVHTVWMRWYFLKEYIICENHASGNLIPYLVKYRNNRIISLNREN